MIAIENVFLLRIIRFASKPSLDGIPYDLAYHGVAVYLFSVHSSTVRMVRPEGRTVVYQPLTKPVALPSEAISTVSFTEVPVPTL